MPSNNYNSVDTIISSINEQKKEIFIREKELKRRSKNKISRFLSSNYNEKRSYKLYRKEQKMTIKLLRKSIDRKQEQIVNSSTFNFDTAMQFIVASLSVKENKKYEKLNLALNNYWFDHSLLSEESMPFLKNLIENICVVTTSENKKKLEDSYKQKQINCVVDIKQLLKNSKYLIIKKLDDEYCFLNQYDLNLRREINLSFPYFKEIVFDLINLQFLNPDLPKEKATNKLIKKMSPKYLQK